MLLVCGVAPGQQDAPPAGPIRPETQRQFDNYVGAAEVRIHELLKQPGSFLWADTAGKRAWLRKTKTGVFCTERKDSLGIEHGLIHDWVGTSFIPGATVADVLALLEDYDRHSRTYAPDVIASQTLSRRGNDFKVRLRLYKRKIITVVLDTYSDVRYEPLAGNDWKSESHSTRIVQIDHAGRPNERERPAGKDGGFLWRLNSYWLFREMDGGVYVECEAISLSRSVPTRWLFGPLIRDLARDSLRNTLTKTREHAMKRLALPGRP